VIDNCGIFSGPFTVFPGEQVPLDDADVRFRMSGDSTV
jgi:hypothetical protein